MKRPYHFYKDGMQRLIGVSIFVLALIIGTGFITTISISSSPVEGQTVTSSNSNLV